MDQDVIELGKLVNEYIDEVELIRERYEAALYIVDDLSRYKEWYIVEDWTDLNALWLFVSDGVWADYNKHFKVSFPATVKPVFYDGETPTAQLQVLNPKRVDSLKLKLGLLRERLNGLDVSWKSERVR